MLVQKSDDKSSHTYSRFVSNHGKWSYSRNTIGNSIFCGVSKIDEE